MATINWKKVLAPQVKAPAERKVLGLRVHSDLIPFAMAQRAAGVVTPAQYPDHVLGCPEVLRRNADGSLRLNAKGRPTVQVAKEIRGLGKVLVTEYLVSFLADETAKAVKGHEQELHELEENARKAGNVVRLQDTQDYADFEKAMADKAERERAEFETDLQTEIMHKVVA